MPTTQTRSRWDDKFHEPTPGILFAGVVDRSLADDLTHARQQIHALHGIKESVQWLGTPWKWTFVLSCELDPTRALAYLIPEPARPQVCIPLTAAMIRSLPMRRLKKSVREGIMYSKVVAGTYWPTWELGARASAEDVLDLVSRKYKHIHVGHETLAAV